MGFQKRVEDFTCAKCGAQVVGDGYTNHCPRCLWSKHVDIEPGDRAATCGGMMRPVRVEGSTDAMRIRHRCEKCGHEKANDLQKGDDSEAVVALARTQASA